MNVIEIIRHAQGGGLIPVIASAAGVHPLAASAAFDRLVPAIAGRIADKARDPDEEEELFAVLDAGEQDVWLDRPKAALSKAAIEDGEDILAHLYGSLDRARTQARRIGAPEGVKEDTFARLMTLAATLTLAAMARRRQLLINPAAGTGAAAGRGAAAGSGEGSRGLFDAIVGAVIGGIVQGVKQSLTRRTRSRRSRTTYGRRRSSTSKRKRSTARRKSSPSIDDLIGDILKQL